MVRKKAASKQAPKRMTLEVSRASAVFWAVCLFLVLGWTFVLGILVGRGFLPKNVKSLSEIQGQISKLKDVVNPKRSTDLEAARKDEPDPKFAFYDNLSAKKEDVARKSRAVPEGAQAVKERGQRAPAVEPFAFTVQLASLESEEKAVAMVARLKKLGHAAYMDKTTMNGKTRYRIRCGEFRDPKEAGSYAKALVKDTGIAGFVTRADR
jgi:septal ring-binding cell division protein DamX